MGLVSTVIAYTAGRRHGRRRAERRAAERDRADYHHIAREDCGNYHLFCRNFGSCDGQECEAQ